jgi:hypothetical protein
MAQKFLNEDGLQYFATRLCAIIDQKTDLNVASLIDETSTNSYIAGAKAVYDFLHGALKGISTLKMEVVDVLPTEGEDNIIYLVQADVDTYTQNIYTGGNWYDLGTTEIDLSGYLTEKDMEALTSNEIQGILDNAGF